MDPVSRRRVELYDCIRITGFTPDLAWPLDRARIGIPFEIGSYIEGPSETGPTYDPAVGPGNFH